jgi:hypothetical protein
MNTALLRHAIDNIWCNPGMDRQFVYKLARLTPRRGVQRQYTDIYERIPLPVEGVRYHIYQTGRVVPLNLGLPTDIRQWHRLDSTVEGHKTLMELYTASGIQFPRFNSYLWITPSRNLLFAVPINERVHELEDSPLYLRLYDNAYWTSERSDGERFLFCRGLHVTNDQALLAFQRKVRDIVDEYGGYPYYFVNGRFVNNISLVSATDGDVVEFVLDGSIKAMHEFVIEDLPTFQSELDEMNKYLLHYPGEGDGIIEYRDDCDLFVYQPGVQNRFMGLTYHRNQDHWLRMVTHKDYSIPVPRLTNFVTSFPGDYRHAVDPNRFDRGRWESLSGKVLRLYLRHSGYHRPLVPEANRLQELYKLPEHRIVAALRGTDSLVEVWTAKHLERSAYIQFMSLPAREVYPIGYMTHEDNEQKVLLQEMVGEAYGYYAAGKVLADTPKRPAPLPGTTTPYVSLPWEHQRNSTLFEYNAEGELLGYHLHTGGVLHQPRFAGCQLVEGMAGRGGGGNTVIGRDPVELATGYDFRLYVRPMFGGVATGPWEDITFAEDRHEYGWLDDVSVPHRWVWTLPSGQQGVVRQDNAFVLYALNLIKGDGHLRFSIEEKVFDQTSGDFQRQIAEIPHGQYDLFLNGRALAEDIDFIINWPEVVIFNTEYLNEDDQQQVMVRGYGFCQADLTRHPKTEVGFVTYGVLSHNHHYDIHSNRVLRVIVDGRYRHPDDVIFDEDDGTFQMEGVRNGAPYYIQTPFINFREVYADDYVAREKDEEINRQVSNYLTEYFPQPAPEDPNFIDRPYRVISPFTNKLIHDLREGWFYPPGIEGDYSHHQVREWCEPYRWLLPFDLCNRQYDEIHINVIPHWHPGPISLTLYQYRFLVRALEAHLNNPPDLSAFVNIS